MDILVYREVPFRYSLKEWKLKTSSIHCRAVENCSDNNFVANPMKYLQNNHLWVIPSSLVYRYISHLSELFCISVYLPTVGLCASYVKPAGLAIHLWSSSSPVHLCCLVCQHLALWEESVYRAYAGWGRCRPLFRAANRGGCNWIQEEDGDNRKYDYGGGCRDGCGRSSHSSRGDRQWHAHSSHEKVWQDTRRLSEDIADVLLCCSRSSPIQSQLLNVQATPARFSCLLATIFCYCLHSCTSNLCFVLVSHLHLGESHAVQAGVVLILCVLNIALCPPTDSFTK